MYLLDFKKFYKEDYFQGLEDELGITWEDIAKVYEDEPWVLSHVGLGKELFKVGGFSIVPGTLNQNGADVVVKTKTRSYFPGKKVASTSNDKVYHLNKIQLLNLLTRGWIAQ